ncbi:MAG: pilin [Patescibacteria group bacterium]
MKRYTIAAVGITIAVVFVASVTLATAATPTSTSTLTLPPGQPVTLPFIEYVVSKLTDFLLYISGTVAVFFVVLSGILWATSGGDPGKLESAKNMLRAAIIGSIIIFGVGVIVNTIENCIQGDCLSSRGFFGGGGRVPRGAPCSYDSQCVSRRCSPVLVGTRINVCQ